MPWPKTLPPLTPEQERIRVDFMRHWHEVLPRQYGVIERFNHEYVRRRRAAGRTLELGAGLGEHIRWESPIVDRYVAVEVLPELASRIRRDFPDVEVLEADCQEPLPLPDASFDRVLAVHVLEHLPNLPAALDEVKRLLAPGGVFTFVIPCEGGTAYGLARRISAQRIFERRYGVSYDWFISREHINRPDEILSEVVDRFEITDRAYFPLRVPSVNANLVLGVTAAVA